LTTRSRLDIGRIPSADGVQVRGSKVLVRSELYSLLRDRGCRVFSDGTDRALPEPVLEPHEGRNNGYDLGHRASKDVLAVIIPTIQDQSDGQKERVQGATLDRVPDDSPIESVELGVRDELARILGLSYPPYEEAGDDDVSDERDREQGWRDGFDL